MPDEDVFDGGEEPTEYDYDFVERVADRGPARAGFTLDGGIATATYIVRADGVEERILDVLGACEPNGDGGLARRLPGAHPRWWWMFAARIVDLVGIGQDAADVSGSRVAAAEELEAPALLPEYWRHPRYEMQVEYARPMYALLSDEEIAAETIEWVDEDDSLVIEEVYPEWRRFCWIEKISDPEVAYVQQGGMVFRRGDGGAIGSPDPHKRTFHGYPRVGLPRAQLRVHWYAVPYSYVLSQDSFFDQYAFRINQIEWMGYPPGSLLYTNVVVNRVYAPPVPDVEPWFDSTVPSAELLCDLTINLLHTRRAVPSPHEFSNGNWLGVGWNTEPFVQTPGEFHTVSSVSGNPDDDPDKQRPKFLSFPIQKLFQDPDV